jgi:hypothetical protein
VLIMLKVMGWLNLMRWLALPNIDNISAIVKN